MVGMENSVPGDGSRVLECSHEGQEGHAARQHRLLRMPKRKQEGNINKVCA